MNELLAMLFGLNKPQLVSPMIPNSVVGQNIPKPTVVDLIKQFFPEDPQTAQAIFTHESQLGKFFKNLAGSNAYGVAQIMLPSHRSKIPGSTDAEKVEALRDPQTNLKIARQVYDEAGGSFNPWQSYTSGAYKKYVK